MSYPAPPDTWADPARSEQLRDLWDEGLPATEIGKLMGLTKNQILGRAHRLNLAKRHNPAEPRLPDSHGISTRPRLPRAGKNTLPKIETLLSEAPPPVVIPKFSREGCCFPIGEPGKPGFRFCEAVSRWGRSYCDEHHAVCYVHVPASKDLTPWWRGRPA